MALLIYQRDHTNMAKTHQQYRNKNTFLRENSEFLELASESCILLVITGYSSSVFFTLLVEHHDPQLACPSDTSCPKQ